MPMASLVADIGPFCVAFPSTREFYRGSFRCLEKKLWPAQAPPEPTSVALFGRQSDAASLFPGVLVFVLAGPGRGLRVVLAGRAGRALGAAALRMPLGRMHILLHVLLAVLARVVSTLVRHDHLLMTVCAGETSTGCPRSYRHLSPAP
ncbi:hypothetical protein CHELA1G11_11337 [Hyphomicrobiales bacterium]|nr:hypothetical protein CHELA1G11_11337 [Hyphomicrobiales bacterium]CAH1668465.1 hypothetical protein CHELA1G2_12971 [Hyphomicrobiales bacterium]